MKYVKPIIRKYSVMFSFRPEDKIMEIRRKSGKALI
jgi:hypothetical protein